jgi:undecaprenyl-diphosphatase
VTGFLEGLVDLPAPTLCGAVFLFAALETAAFAGLAVPGETAVLLGGVVAFQGRVSVWAMAASAALGAIIGDSAGFYLGRRLGARVLNSRLGRLVSEERIASTMQRIRSGGRRAVILGRFVGVIRAVMPFAAGMSGMRYGSFLLASVVGATSWGVGLTLLGYLAGNSWRRAERYLGQGSTALGLTILVVILLVVGYRKLAARRKQRRSAGE